MVNQQRLHAALRDFAHTLVHRYDIGDVLYKLSDDVTDVVGTTGSGVSLIDDTGELRFVTATGEAVEEVERLQDRFGEGPCRSAAATATVMVVSISGPRATAGPSSPLRSSIGGC